MGKRYWKKWGRFSFVIFWGLLSHFLLAKAYSFIWILSSLFYWGKSLKCKFPLWFSSQEAMYFPVPLFSLVLFPAKSGRICVFSTVFAVSNLQIWCLSHKFVIRFSLSKVISATEANRLGKWTHQTKWKRKRKRCVKLIFPYYFFKVFFHLCVAIKVFLVNSVHLWVDKLSQYQKHHHSSNI